MCLMKKIKKKIMIRNVFIKAPLCNEKKIEKSLSVETGIL